MKRRLPITLSIICALPLLLAVAPLRTTHKKPPRLRRSELRSISLCRSLARTVKSTFSRFAPIFIGFAGIRRQELCMYCWFGIGAATAFRQRSPDCRRRQIHGRPFCRGHRQVDRH